MISDETYKQWRDEFKESFSVIHHVDLSEKGNLFDDFKTRLLWQGFYTAKESMLKPTPPP